MLLINHRGVAVKREKKNTMEISRSRYLENEGFLIVSCNNFYNNRVLKRLWNNIVHGNERHNEGRYFYIQVCNLQLLIGDASSDCFCFVWFIVAAFVASFDALNHPLPPTSFLFFFLFRDSLENFFGSKENL